MFVKVPAVCGNVKRPLTITSLAGQVSIYAERVSLNLTFLTENRVPDQVSINKLHLRSILCKSITVLIGRWAVLEILIET